MEKGGALVLNGTVLKENENNGGQGGGVYAAGAVTLQNGSAILRCEAADGGGIYLAEGGSLTMNGGQIAENKASGAGGGVFCCARAAAELAGSPRITANTAGGRQSNLSLGKDAPAVSIAETLENGARVGITAGGARIIAKKDSALANSDISAFFSDEGLFIGAHSGALETSDSLPEEPGAASVTGRVLLEGRPVQNASVTARDRGDGTPIAAARTDEAGRFHISLPSLSPLRLTAAVEVSGKRYGAVAESAAGAASFGDLALKEGWPVSGTLSGGGAEGAAVRFTGMDGRTAASDTAYGGGGWDVLLPEAGVYAVTAQNGARSGSGRAELLADGSVSGAEISLADGILAEGRITGRDGRPAAGVTVTFTGAAAAAEARAAGRTAAPAALAVTDHQGHYIIGGVQEGAVYEAAAFSPVSGEAAAAAVRIENSAVVTEQGGGSFQLNDAVTLTGTAGYLKSYMASIHWDYEYPQDLKLELLTPSGVKVAESPVDPRTGAFAFSPVYDGSLRLAAVSLSNPSVRIESAVPVMTIAGDSYTIQPADPGNGISPGTFGWMVNAYTGKAGILVHHTRPELSQIWVDVDSSIFDPDDAGLDLSPGSAAAKWIIQTNSLYKTCSALERDMLPSYVKSSLNRLLDRLADLYKVRVTTVNNAPEIISAVETSLGEGEDITEAARHIAAGVASENKLSADAVIDLSFTLSQPSPSGVSAVREALVSGEILEYFDLGISAVYSTGTKSLAAEQISVTGEPIRVSLSLAGRTAQAGDYAVIRVHMDPETGIPLVDTLPARLENGRIVFETDRFSTYAIAYAMPGRGVVIEVAPPPSNSSGSNGVPGLQTGGSAGTPGLPMTSMGTQYGFWMDVNNQIRAAADGTSITIDAGKYGMVPSTVIQALAGRNVTLIIKLADGRQITLDGRDLTARKGVLYYTVEELLEMSEGQTSSETSGAAWEGQDPSAVREASSAPEKGGTENLAVPMHVSSQEISASQRMPGGPPASGAVFASAGAQEEAVTGKTARGSGGTALLAAALAGACLFLYRKRASFGGKSQ